MKWLLWTRQAISRAVLLLGVLAFHGVDTRSASAASRIFLPAAELIVPEESAWSARGMRGGRPVAARGPRGGMAVGRHGGFARPGGRRPGVATGHRQGIARPGRPPGVGNVHRPVRPGVRPGRRPVVVAPRWRRPASYWWRPGGAVAAGAALGFIGAAAAASYAGPPPASGYCWYYTNPQRTQGFWDLCP